MIDDTKRAPREMGEIEKDLRQQLTRRRIYVGSITALLMTMVLHYAHAGLAIALYGLEWKGPAYWVIKMLKGLICVVAYGLGLPYLVNKIAGTYAVDTSDPDEVRIYGRIRTNDIDAVHGYFEQHLGRYHVVRMAVKEYGYAMVAQRR